MLELTFGLDNLALLHDLLSLGLLFVEPIGAIQVGPVGSVDVPIQRFKANLILLPDVAEVLHQVCSGWRFYTVDLLAFHYSHGHAFEFQHFGVVGFAIRIVLIMLFSLLEGVSVDELVPLLFDELAALLLLSFDQLLQFLLFLLVSWHPNNNNTRVRAINTAIISFIIYIAKSLA